MSNYRLRDDGYPFKKIMYGRKWIGRVYQHADGTWHGLINKIELSREKTPVAAFEMAVAKHLGFKDVVHLKERNRQVRRAKQVYRARTRELVNRVFYASGKEQWDALDELMGLPKSTNGERT